jgi:hypothetical protein
MWDAVAKFEVLGEGRQSGAPRRCEANSFGRKLDRVKIGHLTGERKVKASSSKAWCMRRYFSQDETTHSSSLPLYGSGCP